MPVFGSSRDVYLMVCITKKHLAAVYVLSFYIMDRGYVDYRWLYKVHQCSAFFITRAKDKMSYRRLYSGAKDKSKGVLYDQTILLNNHYASKDYPEKMRRIKFVDEGTGKVFIFLTNNFHLQAYEIAQLYKDCWKIELFFRWIKQHLKIKSFWGPSENAVKKQVWIAVSVYVLVAIAKRNSCSSKAFMSSYRYLAYPSLKKHLPTSYFSKLHYNIAKNTIIIN